MNIENYKILKLVNCEMIVCEMIGDSPHNYEIINPLKMDVENKMNSGETLNLSPWLQHFTEQKYFSIPKLQCVLIADASVGLSKYYEHVIRKIDTDWNNEEAISPSEEEDVYDDLLMEAKLDSKLIH
tara:strand:- start:1020 stop:1400 length:381 start_codon:yes stop_codon:yes gene_type:complete